MKIYVHCEDPVVTMVIVWQDGKHGTVADLLNVFLENLKKRGITVRDPVTDVLTVKTGKKKDVALSADLVKTVKHMDDLFVHFEEITKKNTRTASDDVGNDKITADPKQLTVSLKTENDEMKAFLNAATLHVGNQRYRKAIKTYSEILQKKPHHKQALMGIQRCYLKADRPKDAFKYVRSVLSKEPNNTDFLLIAGQCCVSMNDGEGAVDYLLKHCKLTRQKGGAKVEDKHEVQVLLAKAYLLQDQKDMAITILQGVLRQNLEHHEALLEYASLLYPLGPKQAEEAMSILLIAVSRHESDRTAKAKFAHVFTHTNGMDLLKNVAPEVLKDAKSLFYLASCLKDSSEINGAMTLQNEAMKLEPSNPGIALAYLHCLELIDDNAEIMQFIRSYIKSYPAVGVGALAFSILEPFFSVITDSFEIKQGMQIPEPTLKVECINRAFTDDENQLLAFLFTCVKLLFIKGALSILPPIIGQIKRLFGGFEERDLHKSLIRNEAAYFTCIEKALTIFKDLPLSLTDVKQHIYFVGDSHCVPVAWQSVSVQGTDYTIHPILSTGTKIWHLRPDSTFYPKVNFYSAIKNIPDGSLVTVCLGEIDCRESLLVCWEKARYDTIEDAMDALVSIYLHILKSLIAKHHWTVYIHPVPPVIDITRPVVMQFNRILATRLVKEPSIHWLNFVNNLLTSDGTSLIEDYKLDGTHIHPRYLSLFAEALNKTLET